MPKIIEIPKLTSSQCEADQKLNEIQKLLDDGKYQKLFISSLMPFLG